MLRSIRGARPRLDRAWFRRTLPRRPGGGKV